jgi:hypothetical protein
VQVLHVLLLRGFAGGERSDRVKLLRGRSCCWRQLRELVQAVETLAPVAGPALRGHGKTCPGAQPSVVSERLRTLQVEAVRDTGFGSLARDDVHLRRVAGKRPCGRTRTRLAGQRASCRLRARRRKYRPALSGSSCSALSGAPFGLSQLVSPVASLCQKVLPVP